MCASAVWHLSLIMQYASAPLSTDTGKAVSARLKFVLKGRQWKRTTFVTERIEFFLCNLFQNDNKPNGVITKHERFQPAGFKVTRDLMQAPAQT